MKTLPYLNLVTHMGSWSVLYLNGILGWIILHVLCLKLHLTLHGLFIKLQLTLHVVWFTLSYFHFVLNGPEMVLEGCHGIAPRTLCLYCRTLAHVMERSGSPPSNIASHILETLDDGHIGFDWEILIIFPLIWDGSPQVWKNTPKLLCTKNRGCLLWRNL